METTKPPPPTMVFDCNTDGQNALWQRLHEKASPGSHVRLIVHLKSGATYVGDLSYFDRSLLKLDTLEHREVDVWVRDLAHVLAVAPELRVPR